MISRCLAIFVSLAVLFIPPLRSSNAQELESSTTSEKLNAVFQSYHDSGQFSGTALVASNGEVLLKHGYGLANEPWSIANDIDTRFPVASVSKVFTATAIMQLVEREQIDLDAKIGSYLPELRKDVGNAVTVKQLLLHTSGVKREVFEDSEDRTRSHSSAQLMEGINSAGLVASPGEYHGYTNTAYTLLALIVEAVTGKPFQDVVRKQILEPAGMVNTGFENPSRVVPKLASGYDVCIDNRLQAEFEDPSSFLGAGGVFTTVEDLYRFDRALSDAVILSKETQRMTTDPGLKNWGLGWQLLPAGEREDGTLAFAMFHNGDGGGFAAHFSRFPGDGFVLIMLCNQSELPRTKIFQQVTAVLNGGEPQPAEPMAVPQLFPLVLDRKFEDAKKMLRRFRQQKRVAQVPGAMHLLHQGNMLLRLDRVEDARSVFEFIGYAYPTSAWGYLALGKLGEDDGDFADARQQYQKVLEFDPSNPWATKFLENLNPKNEPQRK